MPQIPRFALVATVAAFAVATLTTTSHAATTKTTMTTVKTSVKTAVKTTVKPATSAAAAPTTAAATTTPSTSTVAAKASGSITVYSGRNEALIKPILQQFTWDTGIKVNFRAGDSGTLGAQILTEGGASPADVFFSQDAGALGAVSKAKLFDQLPTDLISRVAKGFRADDRRWVGISGRLRVVVYNPTLAPAPPTKIDDVLDPSWKGRIGYAPTNASWQSFVTALRIARGEASAKEWLVKFKANDPKAYSGNGVVRDAVNNGDVAIGLINHYYIYEKMGVETRAKVVVKNQYLGNGDIGGLMNVAGVGVLRTSNNKPAALALVDYLLSEKAQRYFAQSTYEYPLISSVSAVSDIPQLSTLKPPVMDLTDLDSLAKTQELLANVGLLTR